MSQESKIQYTDESGVPYLKNVGAKLLSLLNGVKQTVPAFAKLYGLNVDELAAVTRGEIGPTAAVRAAVEKHRPLRVRDLYSKELQSQFPVPDDTKDGVVICKAGQTKATERTTSRGPEGNKVLFYTYADAAMSTTSLFRPEWISEHFVHDGLDAEGTPDWAYNHGHFENQITYFIGPVNFHWISNGKKYVRQMNTGDTNYITPFVPHTFSTREEGVGLILAVTYGGAAASEAYQSDIQSRPLNEYLADVEKKIPAIASAVATDELGGVIVRHHADAVSGNPLELMSNIPSQPDTKALEYVLKGEKIEVETKRTERWGYNVGASALTLSWGSHTEALEPGDSFFIRPAVKHAFEGTGTVLVMEITPDGSSALEELSLINRYSGTRGLERVHSENTQWF